MFDDLQRLFRQSLDAFRSELSKREPEDQVADLLSAMRREMVAARATLPVLEEDARLARSELEKERAELERCERRLALAERIDDAETVRVAREFAERHRERVAVLEQKLAAAEAEHSLRLREAGEMERKYRESDANRFALVAQLRQQQTGERMRSRLHDESGPFRDFARMEDTIQDRAGYADVLEELSERDGADGPGDGPPRPPAPDLEARLEELKRRMGRE